MQELVAATRRTWSNYIEHSHDLDLATHKEAVRKMMEHRKDAVGDERRSAAA